jgi:hypothetical protein
MKVKLSKYVIYSFNVLLLFSTFQVVRADESNQCGLVNKGSACNNPGGIICSGHCEIHVESRDSKAVSSTSAFQNPKPKIVEVGDFRFTLLGCKAVQDRVQCDFKVENLTSIDKTIYVASEQHGGISSTAIRSLGKTTLIDSNGVSYIADSVFFAKNNGDETGQSYFTVYSNTTPKLSVIFTGVETPATIQRLDLVVGEYIKSRNFINGSVLSYSVSVNGT